MEAFGLAALEALAMGARVVAFHTDGLAEVLAGCGAARLVAPGDVDAFANAVTELWRSEGKQRSVAGPIFVRERYDARRMARDLEQIYSGFVRTN
jgi:glycosyltransferase involved in cell wall biosynthesis